MKHDEPKKIEEANEPKKFESSKEVRHEFKVRCFIWNEVGHIKRDCIGMFLKPITNFYCYNCNGYGYKIVNCKKPNIYSNNVNNIMLRNTNPSGNLGGR